MISAPPLPYFDFLLAFLEQNNRSVEKSFGRRVHWGYWPEPAQAVCDDDDYARAAEQLTVELCQAAGIASGTTVLDAGCGFGGTLASLNERYSTMRLTGLNIERRQLERAGQLVQPANGNTLDLQQGDACALPFADGAFDHVLAVECIFHFPSRERFFAEAWRVLAPGRHPGSVRLRAVGSLPAGRPGRDRMAGAGALPIFRPLRSQRHPSVPIGGLAAQAGFEPLVERNVTRNTLPTYRYLADLLRRAIVIEASPTVSPTWSTSSG